MMKALRRVKKGGRQPRFDASPYPRKQEKKMPEISKEVEMLARMWIECDPNRGGGGLGPDDPIETDGGSSLDGKPRWHWFVPRAEASLNFFRAHGYELQEPST